MSRGIIGGKGITITSDTSGSATVSLIPDPKKHLIMSIVKSSTRIVGYLALLLIPHTLIPVSILVVSELIGIVEELV